MSSFLSFPVRADQVTAHDASLPYRGDSSQISFSAANKKTKKVLENQELNEYSVCH
jgi:hypothetical protein